MPLLLVILLSLNTANSFAQTINNGPKLINLPKNYSYLAPDGSQTLLLVSNSHGSLAQFTLPPGTTSKAVHSQNIEEIWYFTSGMGKVWMKFNGKEKVYNVHKGSSLRFPTDIYFQFRNLRKTKDLVFIDLTTPPWPAKSIVKPIKGPWMPALKEVSTSG